MFVFVGYVYVVFSGLLRFGKVSKNSDIKHFKIQRRDGNENVA